MSRHAQFARRPDSRLSFVLSPVELRRMSVRFSETLA